MSSGNTSQGTMPQYTEARCFEVFEKMFSLMWFGMQSDVRHSPILLGCWLRLYIFEKPYLWTRHLVKWCRPQTDFMHLHPWQPKSARRKSIRILWSKFWFRVYATGLSCVCSQTLDTTCNTLTSKKINVAPFVNMIVNCDNQNDLFCRKHELVFMIICPDNIR